MYLLYPCIYCIRINREYIMHFPNTDFNTSKLSLLSLCRWLGLPLLIIATLLIIQKFNADAANPKSVSFLPFLQEDEVTLLEPANYALTTLETHPPLGVPTLRWHPRSGAERYRVQISSALDFANPIVNQITYMVSYTPETALADGDYYWRVQAYRYGNWEPYSEVRLFTKDWTDNRRFVPALTEPTDGQELGTFSHNHFTWTSVMGAAFYNFEIGSDESFSSVIYSAETTKPHHTPTERLPNNRYYWRVRPIDSRGNAGAASEARMFDFKWETPPMLLAPADGSEQPFLPQFSWTAVEAANTYLLEISTDPGFSTPQRHTVHHSTYTPEKNLTNDQEYYWRVQALDYVGNSSLWSAVRSFRMRWDFQAQLLQPANNSTQLAYPLFQWTPIPGAERYQLQVDESTSFAGPVLDIKTYNVTAASFTDRLVFDTLHGQNLFWRVRGIDAQNNYTPWSSVSTYRLGDTYGPNLIYPPYYHPPDTTNFTQYMDQTVGWPLFLWDTARKLEPSPRRTVRPDYYELSVSTDISFQSINFQLKTAGQAAVPTLANPFHNLVNDQLYYWRVRAFHNGQQQGSDMVWITKINNSVHADMNTNTIAVLYPVDAYEAVGVPPLLGWQPVNGANHYHVQISRSPAFAEADILEEAEPIVPNYAPWQGQQKSGNYEEMPNGAYWWRVRAKSASDTIISPWSTPRRFHISHNLVNGNPTDLVPPPHPSSILSATEVFHPPLSHITSNLNPATDETLVDNLHIMLNRIELKDPDYPAVKDDYHWIISFETSPAVSSSMVYGIYIDTNHAAGVGATFDPLNKPIQVDPLYRPEYVLYVTRNGNSVASNQVQRFKWNGNNWDPPQAIGADDAWFDSNENAVQLLMDYTAIGAGDDDFTGSLAVTVFSTDASTDTGILDAVPAQSDQINNPAWVSDMPMLMAPFDTPLSNPMVHLQMPTLHWLTEPYDSIDGYDIQIASDREFTDGEVETVSIYETLTETPYSWLPSVFQSKLAYGRNESLYWRVRVRHERFETNASSYDDGPWSMPMRFTLSGQQVGNPMPPTGTLANTTPTFTWERVEGVSGYILQIDESGDFSRPVVNEKVDGASFTPERALADGIYYWRVAPRLSNQVTGRWSPTMSFTKQSETPTLVAPANGAVVAQQPTFTWAPVLAPAGQPTIATPRYQLQIDSSPDFSRPKSYQTDSTSLSMNRRYSLANGTWYWRVATINPNRQVGAYSATQSFTLGYPAPSTTMLPQTIFLPGTLVFDWQPQMGAANYELQYDDNPFFDSPIRVKTDNAHHAPTQDLKMGTYHWRVKMVDTDRNEGPFAVGIVNLFMPTPTPTNTPTPTPTPTSTPTPRPTVTPIDPANLPTQTPTATTAVVIETNTPTPTATPTATTKATTTPTATGTPEQRPAPASPDQSWQIYVPWLKS